MERAQSVPLAKKTTLGVGGNAREFAVATCEADVVEAVSYTHLTLPTSDLV